MTAKEAEEMMNGNIEHKDWFYKFRLNWMCGKLKHRIEKAAKHGKHSAKIRISSEQDAEQYYPLLAKIYTEQGFRVFYNLKKYKWNMHYPMLRVVWDWENLTYSQRHNFYDCFEYREPHYE